MVPLADHLLYSRLTSNSSLALFPGHRGSNRSLLELFFHGARDIGYPSNKWGVDFEMKFRRFLNLRNTRGPFVPR